MKALGTWSWVDGGAGASWESSFWEGWKLG